MNTSTKLALTALISTQALTANADTVLGLFAGVGNWEADYSGDIGTSCWCYTQYYECEQGWI